MNFYTSQNQSATNFQTSRVLIVRFLRGGKDGEDIVGKVMLIDGEVKRNMGGKTEVVTICRDEQERVHVLGQVFGITLTEEEKEGIKGRNVELLAPLDEK